MSFKNKKQIKFKTFTKKKNSVINSKINRKPLSTLLKLKFLKKSSKKILKFKKSFGRSKNKVIKKKPSRFFKLKKKWRHWRFFKRYFLSIKKIKFYTKLQWRFNNVRILWHQLKKFYLPALKNLLFSQKKIGHNKFYFFLQKLELRLCVLLLRARFCYKLINAYNAIKMNFVLVNGVIMNKIHFLLVIQDLFQKRRLIKRLKLDLTFKRRQLEKRIIRFKWRKYRWKRARFVIWKTRRLSHFNLYWSKKQNTTVNYLEINYKIPACIIIKQPFLKELFLSRNHKILTKAILKKVYFLY